MQATKQRPAETRQPYDLDRLRDLATAFMFEATSHVAPSRIDDTMRRWMARVDADWISPGDEAALAAEALAFATIVAVFTPTGSGSTAIDRLARHRKPTSPDEAVALPGLARTHFRLLQVETVAADGSGQLRDLASGTMVQLVEDTLPDGCVGVNLAAWLMPLPDDRHLAVAAITPLDEACLRIASGFVRPGRPALINPVNCADAVYRQIVRHGSLRVPGLNDLEPDEDELSEPDQFDRLAQLWSDPAQPRDPADIQRVRAEISLDNIVGMLASAAHTRDHGLSALSGAYADIALIQLETVQRRTAIGSGSLRMQAVADALETDIAAGHLSATGRLVFATLLHRLGATPGPQRGATPAPELDKLIARIQALRAKTVEQGCTEQEALTAAAKVAELLDRYGLSLSELDLRGQACEGVAVETDRKRTAPIDECVPMVAAFFDCRVWGEKDAAGRMRYVFFGLPADVAAARYLYALVDLAFARETALFKAGDTYAAQPAALRRTATNSFQLGLGRGIVAKLDEMRTAREVDLRHSSGRDLVVLKDDIVEAELATLGLQLRRQNRTAGRRVLRSAYDQGHTTGLDFQPTPGVTEDG